MSFVFLLVLLPLIQVAYTLDYDYGVQKTYREKFASLNEDGTFKCLSSDLVIRVNQINNDFCDCPDGSDEPGTSACASNLLDVKFPTGWRFQCKNDGFNAQEILHNKVNDGICDCCDGSDEYAGATQCANICADVQEREAKELLLQVERKKISLEKKEKMIQQALIAREEDAPKIEEEKKELESLVNTRDEVAGELPSLEEREKAEKERLSGEFKVLKGFLEKPKDGEKGKPEFKNSCTKWRQTKDCVSKSETNQDKGCDDIISSNESGYCDCVDSKTNHTIKYEKNCDHKPLRCSFVCRASGEEGTLSNVDDVYFDMDLPPPYSLPAANDLREKLKELDGKIEKLRSSIKVRADRLSRNISNEDILRTLTDQCFTLDIKVYTYELCMFKNTHQYSKGTSNGKNTGNWGRFGESTYSSWLSTDDYSRMLYENGDYCWNHEKRMTDVRIVCGPENVLLKVEEPMPFLNQERVDAQFELSAFLFGVRDKSTQAPRNIDSFNELLSIFVGISNAYYLIPERTIGTYMHYTYSGTNFTPRAPVVEVTFQGARQGHAADLEDTVWSFDVKESDLLGVAVQSYDHFYNLCGSGKLGKLHEVLCHAFSTNGSLDRLDRIRLSFSLYSLRRSSMGDVVPTQWNAEALFEIYGYGPVVTMTTSLSFVEERSPQRVPIMISLAMIPLLLLGLAVRTRALPQLGGCITKLNIFRKKRHRELLSANNSTARGEGMALLVFCTDLIVLFFSILSLVAQFSQTTDETMEHNVTVLLGLAVFARSTKLISVLKWSSGLRVVVEGFVTAADQLAMYVVAVFPILFGYSICAFIVYGGFGSRFSTVPYSLVTLICTALGDNLIDTFVGMDQGAYAVQMVFTRIFFCSFLAFFICNVLNVAFSIIQDSYNQAVRVNSDSTGRNSHRCSIAATLSRKELLEMLSKFRS